VQRDNDDFELVPSTLVSSPDNLLSLTPFEPILAFSVGVSPLHIFVDSTDNVYVHSTDDDPLFKPLSSLLPFFPMSAFFQHFLPCLSFISMHHLVR
jgi:hypothetical protein